MANTNSNISHIDNITIATSHHCDTDTCNAVIGNSNAGSIKVITQNIRSIYKNLDGFRAQLARLTFEVDIIILTECWLSKDKSIPTIENYVTHSSKKCLNQNDGIVIYTKDHIQCTVEEPDTEGANFLLLKVGTNICILAAYRSPSIYRIDGFLNSLENVISKIKRKTIILTGDMNIDIKANNSDRNSASYLNLTAELGLLPGHTYPTRLHNCLDHLMINASNDSTVVVMDSTVTDHASVLLCLNKEPCKTNKIRSTTKLNIEATVEHLKNTDFSFITKDADANEATTLFVDCLMTAISLHTKVITVPNRKLIIKPWITPGLLRCIRHRDNLHKDVLKNPTNTTMEISYKRYRNHCNLLLRKLRTHHEKSALKSSQTSKETWSIIKSITNQNEKKTVATELLPVTKDASKEIETINKYFSGIGKELADTITQNRRSQPAPYKFNSLPTHNSIVLLSPDEAEVESVVNNLKTDCAAGWDSISAMLLKAGKAIFIPQITKLIGICFEQGVFPNVFKKSLITPVHKGGNRDEVKNYRPISVLPTLSKILEKILNTRLVSFLDKNNILSEGQFGFRSGKSTEEAVGQLVNHVVAKVDAKQKCIGVFLDLAKAFDTVSIPTLVAKLDHIGIRGEALSIFSEFLSDRTQRVKIGGIVSSEENVTCGVPQGSALSPSLFLVYVNDLCQQQLFKGRIFSYADDTALIFHGETWEEAQRVAELGLCKVSNWLEENLLTLNIAKTSYLQFRFANTTPVAVTLKVHSCDFPGNGLQCSCLTISQTTNMKYLGVVLDEKLSWRPQVELTASRVRKLIWAFKKLRLVADFDLLRTLYFSLAQSIIGYCITVWGGACKTIMIRLERAQRSLLKVMTFKPYRFPTVTLYKNCTVLTVRQLYVLNTTLKQHIITPINNSYKSKRTVTNVCKYVKCKTASARRQHLFLATHIYNKINKTLIINPFPKNEIKKKINTFLQTLDYIHTENLIT